MRTGLAKMIFLLGVFSAGITTVQGQNNQHYNQWSMDARGGLGFILGTGSSDIDRDIDKGKYTGINQFDMGLRYMFNQKYGLRGQIAYNRFKESNLPGVRMTRLGLEGVVNLGYLLKNREMLYRQYENFRVLAHAGTGITFTQSLVHSEPYSNNSIDHNINLMIGLTPMLRLSDRFALQADFTFNFIMRRHLDFDGASFDSSNINGSVGTFSVGIVYYLGNYTHHADWY